MAHKKIAFSKLTEKRLKPGTVLPDGHIISKGSPVDITGMKIGHLTIIRPVGIGRGTHKDKPVIYWECLCDCGNTINRGSTFFVDSSSCGCRKNGEKDDSAFTSLYATYKDNAKKRDYEFKLSILEFRLLTSGDCYYCGTAPSSVKHKSNNKNPHVYIYNGVDRLDSSVGYLSHNCVPCCKKCNFLKNKAGEQEFISWVESVHANIHKYNPLKGAMWQG